MFRIEPPSETEHSSRDPAPAAAVSAETTARPGEPAPPLWRTHLSWGAMAALGWVLYEITTRPTVGIIVACTKFGWNDFLTAHWLLRWDPHRGRGRTCFYFYIAAGLWKITIASFLVTGVVLTLVVLLAAKPPRELVGVGLTGLVGISLLAFVPLIGVMCARSQRIKVWLDSSVHESRRAHVWPPVATGVNSTLGLLFPALLVPIIVTALLMFRIHPLLMFASVFTEGIVLWRLFRGVVATTPDECWGDEDDDLFQIAEDLPADADFSDQVAFVQSTERQ